MGLRSAVLDGFGDDFAWSLLDATPDGVLVVGGSGDIAFASEQAAALFGATVTDLVGTTVDDLLPEALRGRHRAHRTRYRAQPEARAMGAGLALRARRRDGSEFDAEISLRPLLLGDERFVVAAVRDVGERVAAEDHLHRVLHTLDASDDAMFLFDADTLIYSHVNEGAVRLVGYERRELTTMTPLHLNPYSTEAEYRLLIDDLLADATATVHRETRLLARDGHEIPVEKTYRAGPTARDGTRWVVVVARDITARLAAEEELRASQEDLRVAERMVALADDRDRIARDLHDTVIQRLFATGLTLQAAAATADERQRTRLETAVDDLDETIRELRTAIFGLQTPAANRPGVRAQLLEVTADATGALGFEPSIQFEGPIDALADRVIEHLVPTLREALSNVAHHAQATSTEVRVGLVDGELVVVVVDDGCGPDGGVRGEGGGNGLPNLARRAEKLGGTAALTGGVDGGSRFEWRVPAA